MLVDTSTLISITEVNQNFSTKTKLADKKGKTANMKKNSTAYILTDSKEEQTAFPSNKEVEDSADKILEKYGSDFRKLAE